MVSNKPKQCGKLVGSIRLGESRLGKLSETEAANQLRSSALFLDYRDAFEAATGLPLDLVSLPMCPIGAPVGLAPRMYCKRMGDQLGGCPACSEWKAHCAEAVQGGIFHFATQSGHTFTSVAIKADARLVGYFHTGHVFLRRPSQSRIAGHCGTLGSDMSAEECQQMRSSFLQTRVMSKTGYESCIRLLGHFAVHLSGLYNQIVVNHAQDEPEVVRRARAYIAEHKHRPVAFTDVAAAVHLSAFHFCKVFRRATGLTFGNYLSLVRIEDAKLKLQNPHTRISEAAFAVGFQSIAQFNRTFRRFTGETPTQYRRTLYRAGSAVS